MRLDRAHINLRRGCITHRTQVDFMFGVAHVCHLHHATRVNWSHPCVGVPLNKIPRRDSVEQRQRHLMKHSVTGLLRFNHAQIDLH